MDTYPTFGSTARLGFVALCCDLPRTGFTICRSFTGVRVAVFLRGTFHWDGRDVQLGGTGTTIVVVQCKHQSSYVVACSTFASYACTCSMKYCASGGICCNVYLVESCLFL